ncbi:alpha-2-macroglobulin-like protein 1 isoform X2 [Bufo bufo]|uniref:alpha-2-macroglobulin-like protein 1 isoform X2 n=1 Tax=Bufo bufo TaxID=8384 RepID=UPI001ABE893A|nr:alpha-2-macroglobulin-like protein 1 isoform X2 [Bufo bufo]
MWLLCLLLSIGRTQSNKTLRFGLFVPPDLYYPSTATFCLHSSQDLEGYHRISVDLKTSSGSISLYTVQPDSPTWHCHSFQIPEPSSVTETVTISVQGQEAGGNQVEFSKKELTVRRKSIGTLIQTDKGKYNPGQKVLFRMVTIDQDLEVLNKTYSMVELQDPQKNRLAQWKDVRADSQIVELSYQLPPEAALGTYSIKTQDVSLPFGVDQYVLPKYEVNMEVPRSISILDKEVSMSVLGKYTYGEKVQGNVTFKMCQKKRPRYYWWRTMVENDKKEDLCYTESAKIDRSGKLQSMVNLSQFRLRDSDYARQLEVEASLEEEGTEVTISAPIVVISIQSQVTKLSFQNAKRYYQPGAPYRGKLVLESYDGKRLAGEKVHLSIPEKGGTTNETYVTDSAGEVSFQLSTSQWGKESVSLRATTDEEDEPYNSNTLSVRHGKAYLYLDDIYSVTKSSVHIRPVKSSAQPQEKVIVTVDYTIEDQEGENIEFFYLGLVNTGIVLGGQKTVKKADGLSGSFQFAVPVENLSPSGKLLVFTVSPSGGIAADTTEVQVPSYLRHKVSLTFSEEEVLPGSDVQLHLQANGGSMCALRAVDKSVILMNPAAELTESKIKNLVPPKRTYIYSQAPDYDYCNDRSRESNTVDSDTTNSWDRWGGWAYPEKKKDFQNIIQNIGIYLLSSWDIVAPTTCKWHSKTVIKDVMARKPSASRPAAKAPSVVMKSAASASPASINSDDDDDDGESSSKPRTLFLETWLWEMIEVSASGSAVFPATAPHTITEWSAQMFCAGPGGLGLSAPVSIKTFQPFFMDLTLPYSVKRGESFSLKGSVFNYMSQAMEISASLSPSDQFTSKSSGASRKFCLPGGAKETLTWDVTPTVIGQMNISVVANAVKGLNLCGEQNTVIPKKGVRDALIRSVLVVPEGNSVVKTHNSLIISDGGSVSEIVNFELPSSYVSGSEKAFVSVYGDIMGSSMSNIGNLLAMSYGCGEQNMALFAPNVFIIQYMKSSKQENSAVLQKGKDMLEKGYTRQLMYKLPDGSYSAFGSRDPEGSTWLTAFVMKTFSQAKNTVFIDDQVIKQGMDWLKAQQKPNGCFKTTGRLLNNGLKGGVDDEVSLTSYVVSALMESGTESSDPVVDRAMTCIKNESLDLASIYKLALKAYAFTLAEDEENRAAVMQKLDEKATKADGLLYWTQEAKSHSESYWSKPKSVDVEITGYLLLSYSSKKTPTEKERGNMAATVRWLTKQQNANGGFASTQDTVVALQALSKFASCVSSQIGAMTVDVTSENGFHHRFHLDNANRLVLHKKQLPKIPGKYNVTVSGNGTIIMQAVQTYNVLPDSKDDAFVLTVNPVCVKSDLLQIALEFWYTGKRQSTNMVFLEIKMLSGFVPQKASVDELKKNPLVKRVELEDDSVSIYVEEVTSEPQTLVLQAERTVLVSDLKPSIIKIYDYYITEEEKTVSYLINC